MSGATIWGLVVGVIILAIAIVVIIYLMRWLYRRSSKETSFVRTGLGGQKVVMNGGAFVLPIIHEVIPVNMEAIIRESVKPMEKIEGFKILQVDGFGGGGRGDAPNGGGIADSVVNSALRYRAQAPLIDSLLKEIGISGGELEKMTDLVEPPANDPPDRNA